MRMQIKMSRYRRAFATSLVTLLTTLILTGCGFQLRGTEEGGSLPEEWKKMVLVTGNSNTELSRAVSSRFSVYGVEWTNREEANYAFNLGGEKFSQRNLSLNSQARAAEFELSISTRFSVIDPEGRFLIPEREAKVVKQIENDPRNVVGKTEEIRILRQEMRLELVRQIMRQVNYVATHAK